MGLAGEPFDEGVGHDLAAGARQGAALVTALVTAVVIDLTTGAADDASVVGRPPESSEARDALLDGQEGGQVAHRVGRGAQADEAVGPCHARATDRRPGVEPVADGPCLRPGLAVTQPGEPVGQLGVDLLAVLGGEHSGLAHHDRGPPLADLAAGQQLEGAGHLADERPREAQVACTAVGAAASSEGDLGGEALAALGGGDPTLGLANGAGPGESCR